MTADDDAFVSGGLLSLLICVLLMIPLALTIDGCSEREWQRKAVAHKAAVYVPHNDGVQFKWNDELKAETP